MKRLYIVLAALILAFPSMYAQNFRTGYFLDGYMYKYQLNPAFQGERGFIALPAIGKVSVGLESNMALGSFVYPTSDGTLITALHPDVSAEDFLKNIKKENPTSINSDINLFALGFRAKSTYHTLDFSLQERGSMALPGDAFRFIKGGSSDENPIYDLSSLGISANIYAQAAYGFSVKIKDFMSLGFRAKFLMGIQRVETNFNNLNLTLGSDKWSANADGEMFMTSIPSAYLNGDDIDLVGELMTAATKPNMGLAFDFGVSFDILKHITLSASVLDFGNMSWNNVTRYSMSDKSWAFTGIDNIPVNGGNSNSTTEDVLNDKLDELLNVFNMDSPEKMEKYTHKLGMTAMVGLELRVPFYNRISFGALATHRFEQQYSWTEGRFSVNYAPFRWFSISGNYALSTYGESYGAAVNLHPKGLNLFVGVDSFKPILNMTPQYIPIDEINTNIVVGLTFPFGKYNGRYPKKEKIGQE